MKLFKIKEFNDKISYINPEYIISVCANYNMQKIVMGSKIVVQGALVTTFFDVRTHEEIAKILNEIEV